MNDRELADLMAKAAQDATTAAIAAGHSRSSQVTRLSAFAAAEQVRQRHQPARTPDGVRNPEGDM